MVLTGVFTKRVIPSVAVVQCITGQERHIVFAVAAAYAIDRLRMGRSDDRWVGIEVKYRSPAGACHYLDCVRKLQLYYLQALKQEAERR